MAIEVLLLAKMFVKSRWVMFIAIPVWSILAILDVVFKGKIQLSQYQKHLVVWMAYLSLLLPWLLTAIGTQLLVALGEKKMSIWFSYLNFADQLNISKLWNYVYYGVLLSFFCIYLIIDSL